MVFLTASPELTSVVPTRRRSNQPSGINALVGLIALSGLLMGNSLILTGQFHHTGVYPADAFGVVGTLVCTLPGATPGGPLISLAFLPALYAIRGRMGSAAE